MYLPPLISSVSGLFTSCTTGHCRHNYIAKTHQLTAAVFPKDIRFNVLTFLRVKVLQSTKIMAYRPHFGPPIMLIDEYVCNALRPLRNLRIYMYEHRPVLPPVSTLKCSCRLGGTKACTWCCLVYITQQGKVLLICV